MTGAAPEQTFFKDPAIDRAVAMVMVLAAELAVTKDRLRALEVLLEQGAILRPGSLDSYQPDPSEAAALAVERQAMAQQLFDAAKGSQASLGAPADVEQRFAK